MSSFVRRAGPRRVSASRLCRKGMELFAAPVERQCLGPRGGGRVEEEWREGKEGKTARERDNISERLSIAAFYAN